MVELRREPGGAAGGAAQGVGEILFRRHRQERAEDVPAGGIGVGLEALDLALEAADHLHEVAREGGGHMDRHLHDGLQRDGAEL